MHFISNNITSFYIFPTTASMDLALRNNGQLNNYVRDPNFWANLGNLLNAGTYAIQQARNAVEAGTPIVTAIMDYTGQSIQTISNAVQSAAERLTTPDQGYIDLVNEQARRGQLGGPDAADQARLQLRNRGTTSIGQHTRWDDNGNTITTSATGQGTHTRFNQGKSFINSPWTAHNQLKKQKQMQPQQTRKHQQQ